jgi:hypothetical protein
MGLICLCEQPLRGTFNTPLHSRKLRLQERRHCITGRGRSQAGDCARRPAGSELCADPQGAVAAERGVAHDFGGRRQGQDRDSGG